MEIIDCILKPLSIKKMMGKQVEKPSHCCKLLLHFNAKTTFDCISNLFHVFLAISLCNWHIFNAFMSSQKDIQK